MDASAQPGIGRRRFLTIAVVGAGAVAVPVGVADARPAGAEPAGAQPARSGSPAAGQPVATVTDLAVESVTSAGITLSWTAPAGAVRYELRSADRPIDASTWPTARRLGGPRPIGSAGAGHQLDVSGLDPGTRHWFALATHDGRHWSAPSNAPATPPSRLDQVEVWLFEQNASDARNRRLTRVIAPDFVHRSAYEWVGTEYEDRGFPAVRQSLVRLAQDGALLGAGVSASYWEPELETLAPGVDPAEASGDPLGNGPVYHLVSDTPSAVRQLVFKAERQIAAGFDGVEFDEWYPTDTSVIAPAMRAIRQQARQTHGRTVYLSANSTYGGADFPALDGDTNTGAEAVDYYLRNYPFRLQGLDVPAAESTAPFDGTANLIPQLRSAIAKVAPKPFVFFIDYATPTIFWGPHDFGSWPAFVRIASAQILAAGGFPAAGRSMYNVLDGLVRGVFTLESNLAAFQRDTHELRRELRAITPATLDVSAPNVHLSAFDQPGRRIVHVVNGDFDNDTGSMRTQTDLTVTVSTDRRPAGVTLVTPDTVGPARRQAPSWQYASGRVTVRVPRLEYHDVLVIGLDRPYRPHLTPSRVVFPFPGPSAVPAGNSVHLVAVPTQGTGQQVRWSVDGRPGGDSRVGTVTADGTYTAPARVPAGGSVTITAASAAEPDVTAAVEVAISDPVRLPWTAPIRAGATTDLGHRLPTGWRIVEGRGDWDVTDGAHGPVIANTNLSEGESQGDTIGEPALLVAGDQTWTDYRFTVTVSPTVAPVVWYSDPSYRQDTFVGVVARFQDDANYYEYRLCADGNARLFTKHDGTLTQVGAAAPAPFPQVGAAATFLVHAAADVLELWLDGTLVRRDSGIALRRGGIGLVSSLTQNTFGSIRVDPA
ncbi:fibronectin type III domain-containing protein [Streptomyces sp. NBC_00669]|uniref:hypothetical protein n=1 Tax=Streptomyces sp. NBC_00669 TaxID=2976011 RepID=UPI002E300244|nr:hypothetical protein [Streptomyces sp. NBC_00669]